MTVAVLCTDDVISRMVHDFYAQVRRDDMLEPIFNAHIDDWDHHLGLLVDFWSSILLRTGRFKGPPMPKHIALPGLTAELFQRWLALFQETSAAQPNQAMGEQAYAMAQRIAQSLWYGYQLNRHPGASPTGVYD